MYGAHYSVFDGRSAIERRDNLFRKFSKRRVFLNAYIRSGYALKKFFGVFVSPQPCNVNSAFFSDKKIRSDQGGGSEKIILYRFAVSSCRIEGENKIST